MRWYREESKWQRQRYIRDVRRQWVAEARAIRDADPTKKMLLREAKAISLKRLEKAARKTGEFEALQARWDAAEIAEKWRVEKHEKLVLGDTENYVMRDTGNMIPVPFDHVCWHQLLNGNFIDYMNDCVFKIQHLTGNDVIHTFLKQQDNRHKRIMFYRVIRQWTPQHIAFWINQTDRNVRKVYNNMIKAAHRMLFEDLYPLYKSGLPLSVKQLEFCDKYWNGLTKDQQERTNARYVREERRRRIALAKEIEEYEATVAEKAEDEVWIYNFPK